MEIKSSAITAILDIEQVISKRSGRGDVTINSNASLVRSNVDSLTLLSEILPDKSIPKWDFFGDKHQVRLASQEAADSLQSILSRLPEDKQDQLIDTLSTIHDDGRYDVNNPIIDKLLSLSENLTDDELAKTVDVLTALETKSPLSDYAGGGFDRSVRKEFIEILSSSDTEELSTILNKAHQYSKQVVKQDNYLTYDKNVNNYGKNESANDLYNFVKIVKESDDIESDINFIDSFDEELQSDLMTLLAFNKDLGTKLALQISDRGKDVKSSVLSLFSNELKDGYINFAQNMKGKIAEGELIKPIGNIAVESMLSTSVDLLEQYDFNDEQLSEMVTKLGELDTSNKLAYLDITQSALIELVDPLANGDKPMVSLDATERIDLLRENESVRNLVAEKEYRSFYGVNTEKEEKQNKLIELLLRSDELKEGTTISYRSVQSSGQKEEVTVPQNIDELATLLSGITLTKEREKTVNTLLNMMSDT